MRDGRHVPGLVVNRVHPDRPNRFRHDGDFVGGIGRAGLDQVPNAVAVVVFAETAPVSRLVEVPALGICRRGDSGLRGVQGASLPILQAIKPVVIVEFIVPVIRIDGFSAVKAIADAIVGVLDSLDDVSGRTAGGA